MSEDKDESGATPDFEKEVESFVEGVSGLFDSLKDIFVKSKEEVVRGAALGKVRMDIYQLRKDREHFLLRLGEEAYDLLVAGSIDHPELRRPFEKIQGVDQQIVDYEDEIARIAAEQNAAAEAREAANDEPPADDEPPTEADSTPQEAPPKKKPRGKKKD